MLAIAPTILAEAQTQVTVISVGVAIIVTLLGVVKFFTNRELLNQAAKDKANEDLQKKALELEKEKDLERKELKVKVEKQDDTILTLAKEVSALKAKQDLVIQITPELNNITIMTESILDAVTEKSE